MRKVLKVLGIVFLVIAALLFFVPRFIILGISAKYKDDIKIAAADFAEYPVSFPEGGQVTVSCGRCSITIPEGYEMDELEKAVTYKYNDGEVVIALSKPADFHADFVSADNGRGILKDWFGVFGRGVPDSGYATIKYAVQLEPKDYSFWSLKRSVVYLITGIMKSSMYHGKENIYIYEKGNVRGVISVDHRYNSNAGAEYCRVQCEFFCTDDLNTVQSLLVGVRSPEEAYPIISSVKFS